MASADIVLAMGHEIDAFALNVGREDWQRERVQDAFTAAAGTDFRLFISLDMTSIPCASPADAESLKQYIKEYYHHPNQFRYNGLPMISTFSGEGCLFGTGSPNQGWMSAIKGIGDMPLTFIPSFFVDPAKFGEFTVMDGAFSVRIILFILFRVSYQLNAVELWLAYGQYSRRFRNGRTVYTRPGWTHVHGRDVSVVLHRLSSPFLGVILLMGSLALRSRHLEQELDIPY